jgi:hypothetical protein
MARRGNNAASRDVTTMLLKEEFVSHTAQKCRVNVAVMRDVPIKLLRKEFVLRMVQQGSGAAMRGVPRE